MKTWMSLQQGLTAWCRKWTWDLGHPGGGEREKGSGEEKVGFIPSCPEEEIDLNFWEAISSCNYPCQKLRKKSISKCSGWSWWQHRRGKWARQATWRDGLFCQADDSSIMIPWISPPLLFVTPHHIGLWCFPCECKGSSGWALQPAEEGQGRDCPGLPAHLWEDLGVYHQGAKLGGLKSS